MRRFRLGNFILDVVGPLRVVPDFFKEFRPFRLGEIGSLC